MARNDGMDIVVTKVAKQFRIPHEKHATLKAAALNIFNKKSYTEFQALDDVSFEVGRGEFFGIIGRNGSGKSTLLKIIAGIYVPTSGKVKLSGRISPFLELGVGFNPELTARENVYLNGAILGLAKKEIDSKFDEIIRFAELEDFVDMKIKNFSSGMQVRLAFSVAIRAHAEILLIDEVLAVGDANFQEKCIREFAKFKREGRTILFVTHAMDLVEKFCDRALLLDKGRIADLGSPKQVALEYHRLNALEREKENGEGEGAGRQVTITRVEAYDAGGNRKRLFNTGEDITLRIDYQAASPVERPVFGVAFFSETGAYVSGPNTRTSGLEIDSISGEGTLELAVKHNPFLEGTYYATVIVFDWDLAKTLDYRDRACSFQVLTEEKNYGGLVKLDLEWKN